jgi:phage-related minor tail protein
MLQLRTSSLGNGLLIQRQRWKSTTDDIADLTEDQLLDALKALEEHRKIEDSLIRRPLRDVESIATRVPGSFAQKLKLRACQDNPLEGRPDTIRI